METIERERLKGGEILEILARYAVSGDPMIKSSVNQ